MNKKPWWLQEEARARMISNREARAAKRAAQAEKRRQEVERKRREREEQLKKEKEEQERQEQLQRELEEERKRREEEKRYGINSVDPGRFEWNFRHVIFKQILVIDGWGISCEIARH